MPASPDPERSSRHGPGRGRRRRVRALPLKAGPRVVRRVLRERPRRLRRGRLERGAAALLTLALLGYGAAQRDLLPDATPTLGRLDDLAVLAAGFWLVVLLLRRAQQERRLARLVAEGGPAELPPESPDRQRQHRLRSVVLIVLGTALGLALSLLARQLFPA